ncbi:MAG: DUF5979 domain-containing protein [Oscillospiraceae bacterium]|nr:DUF5979 domain-containing protein [Oscillospiraceae bacterium]
MRREGIATSGIEPKKIFIRLILSMLIAAQVFATVQPLPVYAFEDDFQDETPDLIEPVTQEDLFDNVPALSEEDPGDYPCLAELLEEAVSEKRDREEAEVADVFPETPAADREEDSEAKLQERIEEEADVEDWTEKEPDPMESLTSDAPHPEVMEIENESTRYMELRELLTEQLDREALYTRFFDVLTEPDSDMCEVFLPLMLPAGRIEVWVCGENGWRESRDYLLTGDCIVLRAEQIRMVAVMVCQDETWVIRDEDPETEWTENPPAEPQAAKAQRPDSELIEAAEAPEEAAEAPEEAGEELPTEEKGLIRVASAGGATTENYTKNRLVLTADQMEAEAAASMTVEIVPAEGEPAMLTLKAEDGWSANWYGAEAGCDYAFRVTAVFDEDGNELENRWEWSCETESSGNYTENLGCMWIEKESLSAGTYVFQFDLNGEKVLLAGSSKSAKKPSRRLLTCEKTTPELAGNAALWNVDSTGRTVTCQGFPYSLAFLQKQDGTYLFAMKDSGTTQVAYADQLFYSRDYPCYGAYGGTEAYATGSSAEATRFAALRWENVTYSGTEQRTVLHHRENSQDQQYTDVTVSLRIEGALCDRSLQFDFTASVDGEMFDEFSLGHEGSHVILSVPVGSELRLYENRENYTVRSEYGAEVSGVELLLASVPAEPSEILYISRLDGIIDCGYQEESSSYLLFLSLLIPLLAAVKWRNQADNRKKISAVFRIQPGNTNMSFRRKNMKKYLAFFIVLVLCVGIAASAYAESDASFSVNYTLTGGTEVPAEELAFTVAAAPDNPAGDVITVDTSVTAAAQTAVGITFPAFTTPGLYLYTISQTAGNSQGVSYDSDSIVFQVLYGYNSQGNLAVIGSGVGSNGTAKKEGFTNTALAGSLALTGVTDGTAPDKNKAFHVTVTLTAENGKKVANTISYTDDGVAQTLAAGWTGSKEIAVTLKDGETVTFSGIPAGVSYTVTQSAETGYENTITPASGVIGAAESAVTVKNTDATVLPTGISLDSLPYVIVLAVVISGFLFLLLRRKKEDEE